MQYRNTDNVAMTFFGDGATSEGDFHEGLNFAGVFNLPVIFVCQNNQWAISLPRSRQTRTPTIAQKAIAYGIRGIQVDGNDVLAMYRAATEAADRARNGDGATLIEAVTYRMMMHTTADDPKKYRSEEEVALWEKRDPLARFQVYLKAKDLLDDAKIAGLEEAVAEEIQQAIDRAESAMAVMGDPLDMFNHAYAEMPPRLAAQREYLAREIAAHGKEDDHG
jgi:pyruvate dehydrogenase E1 component alpha subunit